MYAICHRYLKNSEDAKDALQECFMRIFQNLGKYSFDKGSFEKWITTITIRHCLTKLDRKKISIVSSEDISNYQKSYDIESEILDKCDRMHLTKLISDLPDGYRAVFNLAAIDGHSHKKIAELLGINVLTSRVRLNRAKKILRERVISFKKNESWVNTI